jgi:hypothetical protein
MQTPIRQSVATQILSHQRDPDALFARNAGGHVDELDVEHARPFGLAVEPHFEQR